MRIFTFYLNFEWIMKKIILSFLLVCLTVSKGFAVGAPTWPLWDALHKHYGLGQEVLLLDPVYGAGNRAVSYAFGGLIKKEFFPEGAEHPEQMSVSVWDKDERQWQRLVQTFYEYDDRHRIVKETVRDACFGYAGGEEIGHIRHNEYYREGDTETILVRFIYEPSNSVLLSIEDEEVDDCSDSLQITRYLNKQGLPDSIVRTYKDVDRLKEIFRYDHKRWMIEYKSISWLKDKLIPMYDVAIEYKGSKIIYTSTITPELKEILEADPENFSYLGSSSHDLLSRGPLVYTFEFDNKKRLVSKLFKNGDVTALDARYTYDREGRQEVRSELHIPSLSFLSNSVLPFDLMRVWGEVEALHYTIKQDEEGFRTLEFSIRAEDDDDKEFRKFGIITDKFDSEGRLLFFDLTRYDPNDGELNDRELTLMDYRTEEGGVSVQEKTTYRITDEEEGDIYKNGYGKELIKTDSVGRLIYKERYDYDYDKQEWTAKSIQRLYYDRNGYKVSEEKLRYSYYHDDWEGEYLNTYVNDAQGRVLFMESKDWAEGKWIDNTKEIYEYDEVGNKIYDEELAYSKWENKWIGRQKNTGAYSGDGEETLRITYRWSSADGGSWIPSEKREYVRDEYSVERTIYDWGVDDWVPNKKNYEKEGPSEEYASKSWEWNSQKNDWQPWSEFYEYRNEDLSRTRMRYCWNDELGKLTGEQYMITRITDEGQIQTHHHWDSTDDAWYPQLRHTESEDDETNKSHLFEKYDRLAARWVNDQKVEMRKFPNEDKEHEYITQEEVCRWDAKAEQWVSHSRVRSNVLNGTVYHAEYSEYDKKSGRLKPYAVMDYDRDQSDPAKIYSLWSDKTNAFEQLYQVKHPESWNRGEYKWDALKKTWVEYDRYTAPVQATRVIESTKDLFWVDVGQMVKEYLKQE